jgi:hypothetical protein
LTSRISLSRFHTRWPSYHACLGVRLGGVSGGRDTQGCRDSSQTAMVGAGKFGSARSPIAKKSGHHRSRVADCQQLGGEGAPSVIVTPMVLLDIAKLEVSINDVPAHVTTETGGATVMSGLRPGAVAADGTFASLKSGVATVLGVDRGTGLPTKELVSVESAVAARDAGSVMVAVGLQMLNVVVMPNGVVIGSGAAAGGEATEGLGPAEDDDEDLKPALAGAVAVAAALGEPTIPVVGHIVTAPSDVPPTGPNMPR